MRTTKRASVWPVGLVGKLRYETPILKNGKVHSFFTAWKPERPFAMDMAGFAVNIKLLFEFPEAKFLSRVKRGYLESAFLDQLTSRSELEPKADNCTKVGKMKVCRTLLFPLELSTATKMSQLSLMDSRPVLKSE